MSTGLPVKRVVQMLDELFPEVGVTYDTERLMELLGKGRKLNANYLQVLASLANKIRPEENKIHKEGDIFFSGYTKPRTSRKRRRRIRRPNFPLNHPEAWKLSWKEESDPLILRLAIRLLETETPVSLAELATEFGTTAKKMICLSEAVHTVFGLESELLAVQFQPCCSTLILPDNIFLASHKGLSLEIESQILAILQENRGQLVSYLTLYRKLGLDIRYRIFVVAAIGRLRDKGYVIKTEPRIGYIFTDRAPP